MRRKLQRTLLIFSIFAVAFLGVFAMLAMRPEPPKREQPNLAMLVDAIELEAASADVVIRSQGTVMPQTETVLSAEVSGAIIEMSPKFLAGGVFKRGETLMRIDPTNYRTAVDRSRALVNQRQIEHDGALKLRTQGYRAEAEYAAAQAALAAAKADLTRAERDLERTYIRLPYDGIVRSKDADLGQFVNPGTRLGVTFATDFAEVRLPLTDQDLAFMELPDAQAVAATGEAEGQPVTLSAIQRGERREWNARIVRSEGVVDEKSRVTYAVARIDDPYGFKTDLPPLPMGTFVAASVEGVSPGEMIRVPRSTIRGSNQLIFVDADSRIRIREVDVFRFDANYAYLRNTTLVGERVVVTALENPINGMQVRTTLDDEQGETDDASRIAATSEESP
jgi:RND family efflux transporter MFP subunit